MKILLTGGAGYIGSHTYVELTKQGHEAVIVDNFSNSSPVVLNRLETITGKSVRCYRADVCNRQELLPVFQENSFDAVIHFAGYKAVGESVHLPGKYYRNNLDSTLTLTELMAEFGVKRIVFSSSATVYSLFGEAPFSEDMTTGCTNPYGWTKYMNEQILRDLAAADPDWSVVLLRYFNPVGAHESGLIGEDPVGIPNNLMPYISEVASGKLKELSVYGSDYPTRDGTGLRDYIHVMDLASGHEKACTYAFAHTGCEVFNLGTGTGYTVLEMVKAFEKMNGIPVPYKITDRRPGDIASCYADCAKAEKILHWRAEKNLDDMCRDTWHWQKNNPYGYQE